MKIIQAEKQDLNRIGQYMTQMNRNQYTGCTYLGDDERETIEYLHEIFHENEESCYYIEEHGIIVAAIAGDRVEDNMRVEVLGPYVNQEIEQKEIYAQQLIRTLQKAAPQYQLTFFHPCANTFMRQVLMQMNAKMKGRCYGMELALDTEKLVGTPKYPYEFYSKQDNDMEDVAVQIANLHNRIFQGAYYNGTTLVEQVDGCNWLVYCMDQGRVTAYASFNAEEGGYLDFLATVPEDRNKGYARTLLYAVNEKLEAYGCQSVCLTVDEEDIEAIQLYRTSGYQETSYSQSYVLETT